MEKITLFANAELPQIIYSKSDEIFTSKPTDKQIQKLRFTKADSAPETLIRHIESGKSFTCATFSGTLRQSKDFVAQNIYALDFDGTISLKRAEQILSEYGLKYNFGYYTFRHTKNSARYRLLFFMDGEVINEQLAVTINKGFRKFFEGKTDNICIDVSRIWAGTNKKCFIGDLEQRINIIELLDKFNLKIFTKDKNRSRYCIDTNDIVVTENRRKTGFPIRIYNRDTHISPVVNYYGNDDLIDNWKINDLLDYKLFRLFYEGKPSGMLDKLGHIELVGIATNLAPLKGGRKLFKQLLDKNNNYSSDKYSIISYVVEREYLPQYFREFSPYDADINNPLQTFPQAVRKKGQIIVDEHPELITLQEAEDLRDEAFESVLKSDDRKIYLFKCGAGLGKTQIVKNLKNVVVAFPNHQLKDEHFQSSKLVERDEKLATPQLGGIFTRPVADRLEILYSMDLSINVMLNIESLANGQSILLDGTIDKKDIDAANNFLEHISNVQQAGSDKTIFTTHSKAIIGDFSHDTIIYDEDPISAIFEQHKALKSELLYLAGHLTLKKIDCTDLYNLLDEDDFDLPKNTPNFRINRKTIYDACVDGQFKSHIIKFFQSESYYIEKGYIHYFINQTTRFNPNKKYIICDATASEAIYRKLFDDRLEVINISNIQNLGTIEQFTKHSCSRTQLPKYIKQINEVLDNRPTITFKKEKSNFKNPSTDIHFGNVRGSNVYEGKNINVVGTPHYHPSYYKFLCKSLNFEVNNFDMENKWVQYNGRRFQFMTFSHPELQEIHLQTVEGELIQAVHRARLIRTNANVHVYSNFPLEQANYHY